MSDLLRVPDGGRQFLLSYYGDDLTGSADVMEVLETAGIATILYLRQPTPVDAAAIDPSIRAVGVAGTSRTMSVAEMDAQLPTVFTALAALDASMFHYKLCSTFDSSPAIGSIGRALEIARERFGTAPVPLVVGSPPLGRYTVFGDLYARAGETVYRLDRHPTLPSHPVTPMREADLLRHLAAQTDLPLATMTTLDLDAPAASLSARYRERMDEAAAVALFDVLTMEHLARIGSLLWPDSDAPVPLVAGSSGVETALVEHWRRLGWLDQAAIAPPAGERKTVLVLSGSCSEATRAQLDHAAESGYGMLHLPPSAARDPAVVEQTARQAADLLANGRSVAVFTARGPADCEDAAISAELGEALAEAAFAILERARPGRVVVAGGDTSGRVARRLGIDSLRMVTPIAPGSPLCRAQGARERIDGLEIALKGGQVGDAAYFEQVRQGRA